MKKKNHFAKSECDGESDLSPKDESNYASLCAEQTQRVKPRDYILSTTKGLKTKQDESDDILPE